MRRGGSPRWELLIVAAGALLAVACRPRSPTAVEPAAPAATLPSARPGGPERAADLAPGRPPFTLLLQHRMPVGCNLPEPAPVAVACRDVIDGPVQRTCTVPESVRELSGDHAVHPPDVDAAITFHEMVAAPKPPSDAELEAVRQALVEADEWPYRVARVESYGVSDSYVVDLDGNAASDRLDVVYGSVVDQDGVTKAVRMLVAVTFGDEPRAHIVTGLGRTDVFVRGTFVIDGATPLVWIAYQPYGSSCYQDDVLQLSQGRLDDTRVFSACCQP